MKQYQVIIVDSKQSMFSYSSESEKQICLSKDLGAPVGSMIVGSKSFISKARILRKTLGGGMRQVGVVCAAAIIAIKENVGKLEGDHRKAKVLAEGVNKIKGLKVDLIAVETNIIFFDVLEEANITESEFSKVLGDHGVLVMPEGPLRVRLVVHHQISDSDVQYTLSCIQKVMCGFKDENNKK